MYRNGPAALEPRLDDIEQFFRHLVITVPDVIRYAFAIQQVLDRIATHRRYATTARDVENCAAAPTR